MLFFINNHQKCTTKCLKNAQMMQKSNKMEENNEHWVSKLTDKQVYIISFILIITPTLLYYGFKYVFNMLSN
jgi:hypothetical protein